MPVYKYRCRSCGAEEELFCCFKDRKEKEENMKCSKCGSSQFTPVFTKVLVSSSRKDIPEEQISSCGSCSGGNCQSCR